MVVKGLTIIDEDDHDPDEREEEVDVQYQSSVVGVDAVV
jgi:hypothetical protein